MAFMLFSRLVITVLQRDSQMLSTVVYSTRERGRRSRSGATEVMCMIGGVDVGLRRAVRSEE